MSVGNPLEQGSTIISEHYLRASIRAVVITTFPRFVSGLKPYLFFEHIKLISKDVKIWVHDGIPLFTLIYYCLT